MSKRLNTTLRKFITPMRTTKLHKATQTAATAMFRAQNETLPSPGVRIASVSTASGDSFDLQDRRVVSEPENRMATATSLGHHPLGLVPRRCRLDLFRRHPAARQLPSWRRLLKWIGAWLIVLAAVGWATCIVELPPSGQPQRETEQWRRSRRGWEDTTAWFTPRAKRDPLVDPLFFGSLELFLSVAALSFLSSHRDGRAA